MSTVLVVDDDPTVAEVVARYLEVAGHRVEVAADGETALERSAATEPDLVVLDVMLPDISGLAVCQRLRERTPVSVIMLTARDAETDRIQGLEYGADDYVAKPFSPRELVLRVEAVLRRPAPGASCEDRLTLHDGALSVDTGMHEARLDGQVLA
jgi:DNA-binding response OmpR family regulator